MFTFNNARNAEILIIEDNVPAAEDLKKHFKKAGYSACSCVNSIKDALRRAGGSHPPDLVLMNINREGSTDAFEAAGIIRNTWNIPVIFLTTRDGLGRLEQAALEHPLAYVLKPLQNHDLQSTIDMKLHLADLHKQRRMEEKRRLEAEEQLTETLQAIPDSMFEVDREGRRYHCHIPDTNRPYADIGKTRGQTFRDVLPPDAADIIMNAVAEAAETGAHYGSVYHLDFPEGRKWFELSVAAKNDHRQHDCRFIVLARDITERRLALDALKQREDHFHKVLDYADVIIYTKDLYGRYSFINKKYESLLNISRHEAIGHTDFDLFPEPIACSSVESDKRVIESESPMQIEFNATVDDQIRTFLAIKYPLKSDNDVYGLCCIATDMTDRKLAEKKLAKSEERYRKLFENAQVGIAKVTNELKIEYLNPAYCNMLGYREEELVGKHISVINHPESLAENIRLHYKLMAGEIDHFQLEKRYIHKTGRIVHGILTASLVRDSEGRPDYTFGIILDISDRKRIESILAENEERYRLIWENALEGILIVHDGKIIFANHQAGTVMGHKYDQLAGQPLSRYFMPREQLEVIYRCPQNMNHPPNMPYYPINVINRDKTLKWVSLRAVPIKWDGQSAKVIFIRDIHEEKIAEEVLRKGKLELEKIVQKRTAELNNLNIELKKEISKRKSREKELEIISREMSLMEEKQRKIFAEELHDTIGQYLILLNMKVQNIHRNQEDQKLKGELTEVLHIIKTTVDSTRKLTFEISPPILFDLGIESAIESLVDFYNKEWQISISYSSFLENMTLSEDCLIFLYRSANELLFNGVKHSQSNEISITLYNDDLYLFLEVEDDGIGFNWKNDGNLLDKLGMGYGLFSLQARAKDVSADLQITTNSGQGTLASIKIPLANAVNMRGL
jgi:PAS domain S-box-containing protein